MNPVADSYDENLLREAPAATREQLQEGYNPDLLVAPARHKSVRRQSPILSTPPGAAAPALPGLAHPHGSDMEQGNVVSTGKSSNSYDLLREKPEESGKTPFWRSKSGKIVIGIIVALVIIGAVVGGAVGGTLSKKSNNLSSSSPSVVSGNGSGASATGPQSQPNAGATSTLTSIPALITFSATPGSGRTGGISGLSGLAGATSPFGNQDMGASPTP